MPLLLLFADTSATGGSSGSATTGAASMSKTGGGANIPPGVPGLDIPPESDLPDSLFLGESYLFRDATISVGDKPETALFCVVQQTESV